MGSDQHLPLTTSLPFSCPFPGVYRPRFLSRFCDAPLPSSHSKKLGHSRWLVHMMSPFFVSYSLDLYCCLFVFLFRVLPCSVYLDYIAV